jgi:hypothetical protein
MSLSMVIVFIALVLTLFSGTIVCLALSSRSPRCALCGGRIIVRPRGSAACERCDHPWTEDNYYQ